MCTRTLCFVLAAFVLIATPLPAIEPADPATQEDLQKIEQQRLRDLEYFKKTYATKADVNALAVELNKLGKVQKEQGDLLLVTYTLTKENSSKIDEQGKMIGALGNGLAEVKTLAEKAEQRAYDAVLLAAKKGSQNVSQVVNVTQAAPPPPPPPTPPAPAYTCTIDRTVLVPFIQQVAVPVPVYVQPRWCNNRGWIY